MTTPPEVSAYHESLGAIERANRNVWRGVAGVLALIVAASVGIQVYDANQLTQLKSQAHCQTKSFNAVLKDVRLAFKGDKNATDYAQAPKSC